MCLALPIFSPNFVVSGVRDVASFRQALSLSRSVQMTCTCSEALPGCESAYPKTVLISRAIKEVTSSPPCTQTLSTRYGRTKRAMSMSSFTMFRTFMIICPR